MKFSFLIAALTLIVSQQSHALDFTSTLNVSAVYQDGTSVPVNCSNGVVDVTNIAHITFNFQEPYGTHPLGCLKGAANASDLVSECKDINSVDKPVSGPEGWQEFSNSAGYLWTQDYPASKLPTNYNFKLGIRMALVAAQTIYYCQFSTTGSSNVVVAPPVVIPPNSTITGVFPYDCPVQFSPEPPVGTPCSSLVNQNTGLTFAPNAREYAQQHGITQANTRETCTAGMPQGNTNCWTDIEKATYAECLGTYDDSPEEMIIGDGMIEMSVGVLLNSQPLYQWYRINNPTICAYYVPSAVAPQQSIQPVIAPAPVNPTPTPTPVVARPKRPRFIGRMVR